MRIIEMRSYWGRNIYSHKPVIKMMVDLGELTEISTAEIKGFNEKLLELFPELRTHCCSTGFEGGFIKRLQEGTFASHVTEHLALELQSILGYDVHFGKTRVFKEPSVYSIVFEHMNEHCAMECGRAAAEIVSALARNQELAIDEILDRLRRIAKKSALGPSTQAILDEAKRRHIPVRRLSEDSLLQLGYGKQLKMIEASLPGTTGCIAVDLAKNKQLAKKILREYHIPVPEGGIADSEKGALLLADQMGYPLVVKPFDRNQGKGVSTNINSENSLRIAYRLASTYAEQVMIEKYIAGQDYRILVIGDQVSAVAERKPPFVVGDGIHTVRNLVAKENENPNRGTGHEKPLTRIELDLVAKELLMRSGLEPDSIPEAGAVIYLRENANLSTGGSAGDRTEDIHPFNKALAVKAAKALGLEVAGVDLVIEDISKPLTPANGAVIEVNAAPGLRMHLYPGEGQARNVAADILDFLYPPGTPASIPVVSITGTNGKTTVTRMIRHVLSLTGKKVGMTCSSGTYIGEECVLKGDNTGPVSARSILYNREVEAAVLETARGGIVRKGLGYDLADVGIITNISEDHIGLDEINSLKDLAFVKSLVVEAVKPEGYAVLNADDVMTDYIAPGVRCNLVYFSQKPGNPLVKRHTDNGETALIAEDGIIYLYQNSDKRPLLEISEIPITFGGKVVCNIENSLAALAGLIALGVPEQIIRLGMSSFKPDPEINEGRFNLFDVGDFQVLLDYGHNPGGYKSVIQFVKTRNFSRLVGVIGMPGDRRDEGIFEVGRICGQAFDKLYIKEDRDLRGREPGQVARLLCHGALSGGAAREDIKIILSEAEALEAAIHNAWAGDLIVMFYEDFNASYELIDKYVTEYGYIPLAEISIPVYPFYCEDFQVQ